MRFLNCARTEGSFVSIHVRRRCGSQSAAPPTAAAVQNGARRSVQHDALETLASSRIRLTQFGVHFAESKLYGHRWNGLKKLQQASLFIRTLEDLKSRLAKFRRLISLKRAAGEVLKCGRSWLQVSVDECSGTYSVDCSKSKLKVSHYGHNGKLFHQHVLPVLIIRLDFFLQY